MHAAGVYGYLHRNDPRCRLRYSVVHQIQNQLKLVYAHYIEFGSSLQADMLRVCTGVGRSLEIKGKTDGWAFEFRASDGGCSNFSHQHVASIR